MKTTAKSIHKNPSVALPVVATVLLLAGFLSFFLAGWYRDTYGDLGFDSVLYTVFSDLGGVQAGLIQSLLLKAFLPAAACTVLAVGLLFRGNRKNGRAMAVSVVLTLLLKPRTSPRNWATMEKA